MSETRHYQQQAILDLRHSYAKGNRAILLVAPTGSGKTHIAKNLIESTRAKGGTALFLAPRRELIFQTSAKLAHHGIDHGIIMNGEELRALAPVQVASVPTLHSRAVRREAMPFPEATLVVIDEAHLARGRMTMDVLARYPNAVKIGLTATPCRKDGKGLGEIFDSLVIGPTVQELIDEGYLVAPRYYVPSKPDLKGVRMSGGDYNAEQLGRAMDNKTLIGDVLTNWLRLARERKTVIFTVNVAHSMHIESVFRQAGIKIAHLDAQTPHAERKQMLQDLRSGKIQVITNCDVLTLGWDEPSVTCCVLARPTKSLARYMQAVGRALRPFPDKADCIILDHGNCVEEHGLVEDRHEWALSLDSTVQERDARRKQGANEPRDIVCGRCSFVFRKSASCPICQWRIPHKHEAIHTVDDELAELRERKRLKREWTLDQKQQFFAELRGYAKMRGFNPGWASWKYKEKLGTFPRGLLDEVAQPSAQTMAWVKSRNIAWAHRRNRGAGNAGTA